MTSSRLHGVCTSAESVSESAVALAGCSCSRPVAFDGGVEITIAPPAARDFPTRITEGLGVCLKVGGAHTVTSDGRALTYPADAICVRYPGCVWSSETAVAEFLAVDIAPRLLPRGLMCASMRFLHRSALPDLSGLVIRLLAGEAPLHQQVALAALVEALFACGALDAEDLHGGADRHLIVDRARDFLSSCYDSNPTLAELAGAAGANKFVLVRHFRHELGTTPHAYLVRLRVERARALLAQGVGPTDVAAAVGFADLSHLSRHFKRIVGLAPGAYARQARASITMSDV